MLNTPNPTPILIDTDPGIDDAMAILMAFAEPKVEVVGLTAVFGNVDVDKATRNALHLCALAGKSIPVARGISVPRAQTPEPHGTFVHGDSGFGDAELPVHDLKATEEDAVDLIIRLSHEHDGSLVLVPIGPLTNIAAALERDPSLTSRIARVVIMGGAVTVPGNVNAFAEANIWNDPHAAEIVFAADWDVLMVGLDVTEKLCVLPSDMEMVGQKSPRLGAWLAKAHDFYFDFHVEWYEKRECFLHDPTAILALIEPSMFEIRTVPISVTLSGEEKGNTNIADKGSIVRYCHSVDREQAVRYILSACENLDSSLGA